MPLGGTVERTKYIPHERYFEINYNSSSYWIKYGRFRIEDLWDIKHVMDSMQNKIHILDTHCKKYYLRNSASESKHLS